VLFLFVDGGNDGACITSLNSMCSQIKYGTLVDSRFFVEGDFVRCTIDDIIGELVVVLLCFLTG
jgi:hypothetical protein